MKGEKRSVLIFFRKIQQNREESNIESIRTEEFPNGTKNRTDTTKAIHTRFKRTFQDKKKLVMWMTYGGRQASDTASDTE